MVDFVKTTDFDNRLEDLNKNVTSNKHVEVEQKLIDLTKMLCKYQIKDIIFC